MGGLRIAILGEFNFTFNSHHATNLAIDHAARFLDEDISYYWVKIDEAAYFKMEDFEKYDGVWVGPGPFKNAFFMNAILDNLTRLKIPTIITGEGYRSLVEVLIATHELNPEREKLISDNLVEGNEFERVQIVPKSKEMIHLYENHSTMELTANRYSMYPKLIAKLQQGIIDIEAYNHLEEPEVISLANHPFFVATGHCPQISSTREIPHPVIYTFMKASKMINQLDGNEIS